MVKINEIKGLFWGVTLEGNKKYTQTPEKPVHISMAALDTTHPQAEGSTASVMIEYNGSSFVLCTLQHGKLFQQPLDLEFAAGETLSFYITGKGSVHLSGYCLPDDDDDGGIGYADSSEPESDEEEMSDDSDDLDENKGSKRKLKVKGGKNLKKARMTIDDLDEDDEDDSDDDDFVDFEAEEGSDDEDEDGLQDDFDEESDDDGEDQFPKSAAKKAKLGNGTSAKAAVVNVKSKEKTNETKTSATPSTAAASQPQKSEQAEGKKKKKKKNKKKNKDLGANQQDSETKPSDKKTPVESKLPTKRAAEGGVIIEDLKEGHGPEAKIGKMVRVYYSGRLPNGKMFDSCLSGNGFKFKLGKKEVISGWDVGLAGMKVGGKRKLVIPPKMGYGSQRAGAIPPNSTLVFDVELKAVN